MEQKNQNFEVTIIFIQLKIFFHSICITLLSLLIPLAYLFLSRLTFSPPQSFTLNSIILYILISFLSLSSLISSLTGQTLHIKLPNCISWSFLCLFQSSITFGIEATIRSGFQPLQTITSPVLKRTLFFVGIYQQMLLWKKEIVKPLVDDTIFYEERKDGGMEMFLMGFCFSGIWLWLLQREIEPLVLDLGRGGWRNGFLLWLVISATLVTGFVRIVEFMVCQIGVLLQFLCCRVDQEDDEIMFGDNEV